MDILRADTRLTNVHASFDSYPCQAVSCKVSGDSDENLVHLQWQVCVALLHTPHAVHILQLNEEKQVPAVANADRLRQLLPHLDLQRSPIGRNAGRTKTWRSSASSKSTDGAPQTTPPRRRSLAWLTNPKSKKSLELAFINGHVIRSPSKISL